MFIGAFSQNSRPWQPEPAALQNALAPYVPPDASGIHHGRQSWLYELRHHHGYFDRDKQLPVVCSHTGVVLAFWGRIDNRKALAEKLGLGRNVGELSDAQLVLAGWHQFEQHLPEALLGDFAFAIIDEAKGMLFLARDPLGVKPLYYRCDGGQLSFGSSAAALKTLTSLPLSESEEWMARYLWGMSQDKVKTAYEQIKKLPPAHCLLVTQGKEPILRRWHHWRDDAPGATQRDPRWVEEYRALLEESIRCRMHSPNPLGTENSGGIDSATITAYLAKFQNNPADNLYSFGFATCELEPEYILETSQACGLAHNYILSTLPNNNVEQVERGLTMLGYPQEHGNSTLHMPFYQQCGLHNIKVLFSGFGGDEVVTNSGGLLRYELLDKGHYRSLWDILPGNRLTRSLRLAKNMVKRNNPEYRPNFLAAWRQRWPYCPLKDEVIEAYNIFEQYMETARFDAPFRRINDFILKHHLEEMQVTTRLENCTLMAASYGIDYRWPLWDVRLVQQYLSTPAIEKVGPKGMGRYLHRRAISGTVPHKVAWKPSKDMGYGPGFDLAIKNTSSALPNADDFAPALKTLLDEGKWNQQSTVGTEAIEDLANRVIIRRNSNCLNWLDRWLKASTNP